ncbi:MAG: hypothetical protein K2J73_05105 [Oscillospiraceae bacterium]|nr:hypothetical protein [Oscillospiraceae bacterium]
MFKIRIAIVLIFLFILGVALTVQGTADIIKLNGYVPDFNYDSMADVKKGSFVQGYVENIFDCYASETTTNTTMGIETSSRTSEEYFLMPLINDEDIENSLYVTISASKYEDRQLLYAVCDDTWEYLDGNTGIDFTEMYIVARVKKMDDDLMPFLVDWFKEAGIYESASEVKQHVIPYEFVVYQDLNAPYINLIVGLVIIAVFAVAGVILYKKSRPSYPAAENAYPSQTSPYQSENTSASGNGFSESSRPVIPVPDIPQPVQPDDFFAKPERKSASAEQSVPAPESKPQEQAPAFVPGNMDDLDTSALNTDDLKYYDSAAEEDSYAEYEFSNDGDFADADADSIELSD